MQQVSQAYKVAMKEPLRDRGYIRVTFGLINQEAQANASVQTGEFTWFSNNTELFADDDVTYPVYAVLEENFTKVDGSMYFLPRQNSGTDYLNTGVTSNELVSVEPFIITIAFNVPALSFRGLTIDFGENYPVDFDLITSDGTTTQVRGNDKAVYSNEVVFAETTSFTIKVITMKNPQSRLRITSMVFGYQLKYTNEDILDSQLTTYVSPVSMDVPQIDFYVKVKNYDQYFDVDNPNSAVNFLETGQQMVIEYGQTLEDGSIEWVMGNTLLCSDWDSDNSSATIRTQDNLRNQDTEYYAGTYNETGATYYSLAEDIFQAMGVTDYYIDPHLKELTTKNPIPRVSYKEALQIIANATRCVFYQDRNGQVIIQSSFIPDFTVSSDDQAPYSNIENIVNAGAKQEYATLATDYTTVNGTMYFMPRDTTWLSNLGYVSDELSDADGKFTNNPKITIVQEVACRYYGIKLLFGEALPSGITITTYNNDVLVDTYEVSEVSKNTVVNHTFLDFDKMEITFTGTAKPYSRIVLNYFSFGDLSDFTYERLDMLSSPKTIKQELIKEVIVPYYTYQKGAEEESLVSEEVTCTSGEQMTFFLNDASYDFRATLSLEQEEGDPIAQTINIVDSGSYYVTVEFGATGTFSLEIFGWVYNIVERQVINSLNARGRSITWENPLVGDKTIASDLAEWLGDYYSAVVEYSYNTRGNPEIDANDIVYQENDFYKDLTVRVYRQTLKFNGAYSGTANVRRIGGDVNAMGNTKDRLVRIH